MNTSLFCNICGAALSEQATTCVTCGSTASSSGGTSSPPVPVPASPPPPCSLSPGFLLAGRYQIRRQLGQGGFATVYKARDRSQRNRAVAIKQIHLEALGFQEMIDATVAYNREVNHLSSLRNKNLPRIYGHFMDEQHWYIVMEYIDGKTLEEKLAETRLGFMTVKQVLNIGMVLCDALQHLHIQRPPMIFRDLKPSNIILTRSGKLYLIDFGTTRLYRPGWKDTSPLGTPGYAAPEQYGRHAHTTPQTDIYGLGATLQTLLTGKEPLEILQNGISARRARHIPQSLQDKLAHMQERDATRRPRNMAEVKQALQAIKEQLPSQKIKANGTFFWETLKDISVLSYISLILYLFLALASLVGVIWQPPWFISLAFLGGITIIGSIFRLRQAQQTSQSRQTPQEIFATVWKQLTSMLPLALLLSILIYYLHALANLYASTGLEDNVNTDLITFGVAVGSGIVAGICWAIRWLSHARAARRKAQQQEREILIHQKIHNHP